MKKRAAPPISFLQHAQELFDCPPESERALEIYIAMHTPGPDEVNIDRAMKLGLFLHEYREVIDLALQDSQAKPQAQDMLATCLDNLAFEYVTDKDTSRSLRLLKGLINRFYRSTSLPLVFVWQKLCCQFFGGVPAIIPGVTEAQVIAAMSRRYEKYNKGAGFENPPISQPENEEKEEVMNKLESLLETLTEGITKLADGLKSVNSRLDAVEQSKAPAPTASAPAPTASAPAPTASAPAQTASAPAQTASAPAPTASAPAPTASAPAPTVATPQAQATTVGTAAQTPSVVSPIKICPPKTKQQIEAEKYRLAFECFANTHFENGNFDIIGAIESLKVSDTLNINKFIDTAVIAYCKLDPKADMRQIFKLIITAKSSGEEIVSGIKEAVNAGFSTNLRAAVLGYIHGNRAEAFNNTECLRKHANPDVNSLGLMLMGW